VSHILYVMSMQPILDSDEYPSHKKIGITNNTIARASQLATKMPFTMYVEMAWEIPDNRALELETALHKLVGTTRIEGEWFEDSEDTLVDGLARLMRFFNARTITESRLDQEDVSRKDVEKRYAQTAEQVTQLLGDVNPSAHGWIAQPARAVDQRFVKEGVTIYVQPLSRGASLVANGRDNPLSLRLRAKFGERVQNREYGNGIVSDRVQVSAAELQDFFRSVPAGIGANVQVDA